MSGDAGDPSALPEQAPATEGMAPVPDGRVWCWDTGGDGQAVVFVHPNAGSGLSWPYQQPVFAKAGYRVVGYSRRNFYKSDLANTDDPGIASEDLHHLVTFLSLDRFHLIGVAAGGSVATDYALSHPERLRSLTICGRTAGVSKGAVAEAVAAAKPQLWNRLPRAFQEIGPSYRVANPDGVKRWSEINRLSEARKGARQKNASVITAEKLKSMRIPVLLMTGSADLTAPPSLMRLVAKQIPNSELVIVGEAGHSIYWEQPEVFNRIVLDFIGRNGG
ncbi:MAG TPA: alpha/beta hydrolase [Beijerinckiaceae bacterium]|nr:alpha/beta hydrolase [Beijerinckiaceae bacterium]